MGVELKLFKGKRFWLIGGLTFFAGFSGYFILDNFAQRLVEVYRPKLERRISRRFGHSLKIGQYQGLRPWGVSVGPSFFLKGNNDNSSASVTGLTVQLAPIESLINRRPVAILTPLEAKLHLKDNGGKALWVFGSPKSAQLPKFDLRLRLDETSRIFIEPSNLEIAVNTDASIKLFDKRVSGRFKFDLFEKGSFVLKGSTYWNKYMFKGAARINDLNLLMFNDLFLRQNNLEAKGIAKGDIKLSLIDGVINCKGGVDFKSVTIRRANNKVPLSSKGTSLNCRRNNILISQSEWEYGSLLSLISGSISVKDSKTSILDFQSSTRLIDYPNSDLAIDASLPISFNQDGLDLGDLTANVNLKPINLAQLKPMLGLPFAGKVSAKGTLYGPLKSLNTNVAIGIDNPKIGSASLQEKWRGTFNGSIGTGAQLNMSPVGASVPGKLLANFKSNLSFDNLLFSRLDGEINVTNSLDSYGWNIKEFRLDRIELSSFLETSSKRIFGKVNGKGIFTLKPFLIEGDITYTSPRYLGFQLREARIKGSYTGKDYFLNSELLPPDRGQISISAKGEVGGPIWARAVANDVTPRWITQSVFKLSELNQEQPIAQGSAKDLKGLSIKRPDSLDNQLRNWLLSVVSVEQNKRLKAKTNFIDPRDLEGRINGVVELQGNELSKINVDLDASGKVWLKGQSIDVQAIKPFSAKFYGPLRNDGGEFSFLNVPISLLSLFVQVPSSLSGMIGITGKYRLKDGTPEVTADLVLDKGLIAESSFTLDKGKIWITSSSINVDVAFRALSSKEPVNISGQIPFTSLSRFDLRVESHGDGLNFLDGLSGGIFTVPSGNSDLRLYIRGTLDQPIANGFLMIKDSEFLFLDKEIKNLTMKILFDFNRLEVVKLEADIGSKGKLSSTGELSLFKSQPSNKNPLLVDVSGLEVERNGSLFKLSSKLILNGSVINPIIGGDVFLEKGLLLLQRFGFASNSSSNSQQNSKNRFVNNRFPEQYWDRRDPLDLFIQNRNSSTSRLFKPNFPRKLSSISFDNLKLNLGKDFRIVSQPITRFNAEGLLTLNGPFDSQLQLKGVVLLKNGRVNLFTTTFNLDKREPNVAIFAPSNGFIPFIDLKMIARVSDTIKDPSNLASSTDFALNGSSAGSIGGSRLVRVEISATGLADRLEDNFQIRSTPSLPKNQLLNLIGGNSLTMLFGGNQSEILANVLNRSFVSPVLGNLAGTLSERIQFSVYPAFVRPQDGVNENINTEAGDSNVNSDDLSPQQAWVTEMGIDVTERVNFSIQVTPNRDDIPPQGTVTYQFNPNLGVLGSLDNNGNWQSEFQIYIRY